MAELLGVALTHISPLIPILSKAVTLSVKLYNLIENSIENKKLAKDLGSKIERVYDNIHDFSKGSEKIRVPSKVAEILHADSKSVKDSIELLVTRMERRKILSFCRSEIFNKELKRLLGSVTNLEYQLCTFGMQIDIRKEQVTNIELSKEVLNEIRHLKGFLQVHNVHVFPKSYVTSIVSEDESFDDLPEYDLVEEEQVKSFSKIPSIIEQVRSSSLSEQPRKELIAALESSQNTWSYSHEDFKFVMVSDQRKLISGSGGFKTVYEGKLNMKSLDDDADCVPIPVAVLEYNLGSSDLKMYKGSLLREIYFSWRLCHPCIIKTYGAFWPSESEQGLTPKIFSELMTHNLRNGRDERALKSPMALHYIALDIAEGLLYLHEKGFVHRDIKPENVLLRIKEDVLVCRAKICDFGASKQVRTTSYKQSLRSGQDQYTPVFAPPEEFKEAKTTFEYDLWGFGLILCWLYGDENLQLQVKPASVPYLIENGELLEMTKKWVSSIRDNDLRACADRCTNKDPKKRGTMSDVVSVLNSVIPSRMFNAGVELYDKEKFIEAVALFQRAEKKGDASAIYYLACCYSNGKGVQKDSKRAFELLKQSADKGNAIAQYTYARHVLDGDTEEDNSGATDMLKRAADQGHADAQNTLGTCYEFGKGVPENHSESFKYYNLAADQGNKEAERNLGLLYENGKGVRPSYKKAFSCYKSAADKEDGLALHYLGKLYEAGKGTQKNFDLAKQCYQLAARQGVEEANASYEKLENESYSGLRSPEVRIASSKLEGHRDWVMCIAISTDGKMIISGSRDKTIRRWDSKTGLPIGEPLEGHAYCVFSVAISTDGSTIVSGSVDETVRRWNAVTGEPIGEPLQGHKKPVLCVAISNDVTTIISGSADNTICRWNAKTGSLIGVPLKGHTDYITCVAVSPDGNIIVSGSLDKTIRRWCASSGEQLGAHMGHSDGVLSVGISSDGGTIVSASKNEIRKWDMSTGECIGQSLEGSMNDLWCLALSADGKMVVTGSDYKYVSRRTTETCDLIGSQLEGHSDFVTSIAISNDGNMIVSGSADKTLRVWTEQTEGVGCILL